MSTNNVGWVVTNGIHYVGTTPDHALTNNVDTARFWKKEKSANNTLTQLQNRKKAPLVGFYVCFIGVNTKTESNMHHNPNNTAPRQNMNMDDGTRAHMENAQIANNIKDFLSDILGDNSYAKEIVGMHFHYNLKKDPNACEFTVSEIQKALALLRDLTNPNITETLYKELSKIDMEIVDIEHKIEMTNFNAYEGFKLAKELQIAREAVLAAKANPFSVTALTI